ncbi:hypothetical protein NGI46_28530 [Peribacillus butanolivorans]|uniref:hypothetical protein n=1 Tax=Peribacillus TaxID=2675229 RepID=UPI0011A1B171|nr:MULTISPECIES: hypothetical protein [Peribacillus]MCO0601243.1 hypothetical protein [Peribacillus butanolivorans]
MALFFYTNMITKIIATFFQEGIWVIGFFYLLNKTFESEKLIKLSKVVIIIVLAFLLLFSISVNY